jgi:TonB family protein
MLLLYLSSLALQMGLPEATRLPVDCENYHAANPLAPAQNRAADKPGYRVQFYPDQVVRGRVTGKVVLSFDIDAEGRVGSIRTIQKSGPDLLEEAARADLQRWRYASGPVRLNCLVEMDYKSQ